MKFGRNALLLASTIATAISAPAMARETIQIAGSSTVLPFSSIVAEEFGQTFAQFNTPIVGSGGSGGGLRQFCQGVGVNTIDIANSSRAIRPNELENCRANGVTGVIEVKIGYDGIVFASRTDSGSFALKPEHVFKAGAAQLPQNGKMVANPYTNWKQIDSSLPDQDILLVIPGSNHGTREVYEEKVVHPGCETLAEVKAMGKEAKTSFCNAIRTDGRVVEVAGDYTETLARLDAQRNAVGVFGLSFYDQNRDRLKVATVNGVTPSLETIATGEYPVSRPLFFYIKNAHVGVVPGLLEYAQFFVSEQVGGMGSPLEAAGLIPMDETERAQVSNTIRNRKTL
ncbi:substrate-binding domain-containing protein [Vibrio cincinnatiensis]|jgi:phosphate transport system substrate-binding protein|uniref:Phosphate transport system substrate-binding protein n=1 Tax=Vibrio cincinnatiensis DSM 19608 TaxID=1123491 RepID=A0A1T4KAF7_VIBCI|nr:substrate-binding domain-containing protein [Vibrio cincinnatiensis]MCG3731304.1 phosphonate ABC transporter substrate-binding protein [Vibrio cincinnatiensis]MCG3734975.1 phosphonate ABC transporter substrate-binding protein [Vibrio cincinnatiensis]MCG3738817.1 phosphonate ABC transporter substrate-binding protein [Vibrio cincinnatiensis]MCG3742329.1 phosphonate ABC transporter substrate-binding protein [Vibrio cincinnatiensis]MCG3745971.1 phosphonate ABC transporter substrate-binding prot